MQVHGTLAKFRIENANIMKVPLTLLLHLTLRLFLECILTVNWAYVKGHSRGRSIKEKHES